MTLLGGIGAASKTSRRPQRGLSNVPSCCSRPCRFPCAGRHDRRAVGARAPADFLVPFMCHEAAKTGVPERIRAHQCALIDDEDGST